MGGFQKILSHYGLKIIFDNYGRPLMVFQVQIYRFLFVVVLITGKHGS